MVLQLQVGMIIMVMEMLLLPLLNQHMTRMAALQVHHNNLVMILVRKVMDNRIMDSKVMISKGMANRVITVGHNNLQRLHLPMDMDTRNKEEHNRTTVVGTVTSNDSSWQWSSLLGGSFGRCFRDFINLPRILKISVNLMGTCCFYTDC